MKKIIGLTGRKGSGKSTAARVLADEHSFISMGFATPIKNMLRYLGLGLNQLWGSEKEIPCDLLGGETPRYAMQTLGTEWGRHLIHPDLWVNALMAKINEEHEDARIVIEDVRFPNEVEAIRAHGGRIWKIVRDPEQAVEIACGLSNDPHESEANFDTIEADHFFYNTKTLAAFEDMIKRVGELFIADHIAYTLPIHTRHYDG